LARDWSSTAFFRQVLAPSLIVTRDTSQGVEASLLREAQAEAEDFAVVEVGTLNFSTSFGNIAAQKITGKIGYSERVPGNQRFSKWGGGSQS